MKKGLLMTVLIITAIVLGGLIGEACYSISALDWLSYSKVFSFNPGTFDINILTITFGLTVSVNVAQLILIFTAIFAYYKLAPKIIGG